MKKNKIFVIADHPFSPSGVGIQTKYFIESLLETGRYQFVCFGGAIKHNDYRPMKLEKYGDDLIIFPVDGYGNSDMIRSAVRMHKPDLMWIMTDPRFWVENLFPIDNEIRPLIPIAWYTIWDNYPAPHFNKSYYKSVDKLIPISKLTEEILFEVVPESDITRISHAVDSSIFKPLPQSDVKKFKQDSFKDNNKLIDDEKVIFFWNNRNARRKQSGTLIFWFKKFLDKIGHDKAILIMHTDPKDLHGQDLEHIVNYLNLNNGQVLLSKEKVPPQILSLIYNMADCTINISDAEGFGLSSLESLSCGTPIIVNMTGGLKEQVTDGKKWFGIGIEPASKCIIGSQDIPYIAEDRLNEDDFVNALVKIYEMGHNKRRELGEGGRQHVLKNYNFNDIKKKWIDTVDETIEKYGSWETRKNYKPWELLEL